MNSYHNDQAIQGGDKDLLNRTNFVKSLANILLLDADDACFTVSLEAEWGYGKTSVINLVKKALMEEKEKPIIIEYNPWLAGSAESLVQDFLIQFSAQIGKKGTSKKVSAIAETLVAYSGLFSVAKFIPGVEPWASIVGGGLSMVGETMRDISKLNELDLLGKKQEVADALTAINTPIVVIIDDIDRLTPAEVFQVLRLVKAVADFPRVSFLLAFDPSYLTQVLGHNHIANASEYMDKMIQLRLPLPVISVSGLGNVFEIELDKLKSKKPKGLELKSFPFLDQRDKERFSSLYHEYFKFLIQTPRELKRCFNHVIFVLNQVKDQVCFSDLFALSLIAIKYNAVYEHIKSSPEAYIGKVFLNDRIFLQSSEDYKELLNSPKNIVEEFKDEREGGFKSLNESEKELANRLISNMFPLVGSRSDEEGDADEKKHICAQQRLYIALHYATPEEYVSDDEISAFISDKRDRQVFLKRVLEKKMSVRFFEMMMYYSAECGDNDHRVAILNAIYDVFLTSDELKASTDFVKNLYGFITRLTERMIEDTDVDDRYALVTTIIRKENAPISTYIFDTFASGDSLKDNQEWITDENLASLKQQISEAGIAALEEGIFKDTSLELRIFYPLMEFDEERLYTCTTTILNQPNGVIRLANMLGKSVFIFDDFGKHYVEEAIFSNVINFALLRKQIPSVDLDGLPPLTQAIIKSMADGEKHS